MHFYLDNLEILRKKSQKYEKKGTLSTTDCDEGRSRVDVEMYMENNKRFHSSTPLQSPTPSDHDNSIQCTNNSLLQVLDKPDSNITTLNIDDTSTDHKSTSISAKLTENLNFSRSTISRTRSDIEKKLGSSLISTEGLVSLLDTRQLLLAKQITLIDNLQAEIIDIKKHLTTTTYLDTVDTEFTLKPAESFNEYLTLADNLKNIASYFKKVVGFFHLAEMSFFVNILGAFSFVFWRTDS